MASKSRKEKGGGATAAAEVPPEREVIPGKITESQWQQWVGAEESSEVAGEVVRGLVDLAFYLGRDHQLEEQAFSYTVQAAKASLLQIIEWEFLRRDEGEWDPVNDPSWQEDSEPECSVIDSWARGIVPETSELLGEEDEVATPTTSLNHRDTDSVPLPNEREMSTANSIPLKDNSRQPTRASTVASSYSTANTTASRSLITRNTAQKVSRPRPQARRPQARLVALSQPQTLQHPALDSTPATMSPVPSPTGSHTPTTSPAPLSSSPAPPPLLPYNMKPAQLRWQKDITYDSSGKIVDMLRLDPSTFPSHRVRPRVTVSDPSPVGHRAIHHYSKDQTSLPSNSLSPSKHSKTGSGSMGRGRGGRGDKRGVRGESVMREGVRRRESGRVDKSQGSAESRATTTKEKSSRFPEVLTLPALVDTIDLSAGVSVREGNRSVHGPPSPHRPPHFLLPHTTLHPVTLPPPPSLSTTTGDT